MHLLCLQRDMVCCMAQHISSVDAHEHTCILDTLQGHIKGWRQRLFLPLRIIVMTLLLDLNLCVQTNPFSSNSF